MRYDTVIFDLDGTLTNSHDGITNAVRSDTVCCAP